MRGLGSFSGTGHRVRGIDSFHGNPMMLVMAREIAPDVLQIPLDPIDGVNAYLVGDTLVDAGSRFDAGKIARAIGDRPVRLHALTHVHPDHQGSSKALVERYRVPFAVPVGEEAQAESGNFAGLTPRTRRSRFVERFLGGPGAAVDRALSEGDEVGGGFTAIALPGHTPGQLGYWRERDRVLVAGDAFRNLSYATGRGYPAAPPWFFTVDQVQARSSVEKIAELRPSILAVGHGRPLVGDAAVQHAVEAALARDA